MESIPMCPVIRISDDLYKRLESQAQGFDTPTGVIERLLDSYEGSKPTAKKPSSKASTKPELVFHPGDESLFKKKLVESGKAYILLHYSDGTSKESVWNAQRFTLTSNLRGNLWSGYLRNWKKDGIVKAELAIEKSDLNT